MALHHEPRAVPLARVSHPMTGTEEGVLSMTTAQLIVLIHAMTSFFMYGPELSVEVLEELFCR